MNPRWKVWLAAGSALLLVGAGCTGSADVQENPVGVETPDTHESGNPPVKNGNPPVTTKGVLGADVDAVAAAATGEVNASSEFEITQNAEANLVINDAAELKAYGETYAENEL